MKTVLVCHNDSLLDRVILARWLNSFSDLAGIVLIQEGSQQLRRRVRRELKRVGIVRFLDVLAFRFFYSLLLRDKDRRWEAEEVQKKCRIYPDVTSQTQILDTVSPNTPETEAFIKQLQPDIVLARCKVILKESIFSIPAKGTLVMHPGICPEYRNAHGCFWALSNGDTSKVGMTLLRVDKGIDTGPCFGYYSYAFDEARESHIVIQHRVVLENLDSIQRKFAEIFDGTARPMELSGRDSAVWGQPWLTKYLQWKFRARKAAQ
jgi:folate-dependent phosphoribosylglycinamide formyltransferase PurN